MKYLLLVLIFLLLPSEAIAQNDTAQGSNTIKTVSWYAKGLKNPEALTTACWHEYKKGTQYKVTYGNHHVIVTCTDRGDFKRMGRMLDLSAGAFRKLAPLSTGILKVKVEVL